MIRKELTEFFINQSEQVYEASHKDRLDFLVSDLKLDEIENSIIGDFGCGYGPIFKRLPVDKNNKYVGFDAADQNPDFFYVQTDLCLPLPKLDFRLDAAFCFEVLEHVTNPYNLLFEIKLLLKEGGTLFLSIPGELTEHNTIYPGLIYPESNFEEFLKQLAFEIVDKRYHNKNFHQHVYVLRNLSWEASILKFPLSDQKYRGKSPHEVVNI